MYLTLLNMTQSVAISFKSEKCEGTISKLCLTLKDNTTQKNERRNANA